MAHPAPRVREATRQAGAGRLGAARRSRLRGGRWLGAVLCSGLWLGAQAAEPLAVCVAADNAPLSYTVKGAVRGLDVRLAQAMADAAGRPLKLVPFDTSYEKESQLTHEVNALLSSGVCEAVSGFPLLHGDLGAPTRPSARVPDHPGAPRRRERPYVPLGTLLPSQGYLAMAMGLVVRDASAISPPVQSLADLARRDDGGALKLGVTSGTLAGSLAQMWRHGVLRPRTLSVSQREEVLDAVADGRAGAALVALARFDGWKLAHRDSPLQVTAWRRPMDVNLGFVTLQGAAPLRALIDRVIHSALADGTLARWAADEGVSWSAPTQPNVGAGPTMAWLTQD